jgi:hypothetical protein
MTSPASEIDTNADLARKRVQANFNSLILWNTKWTWNWSSELEPTNIRGYCTGESNPLKIVAREMHCNYPVEIKKRKRLGEQMLGINDVAIVCTRAEEMYHEPVRAVFRDIKIPEMASSQEIEGIILPEIKESILRERDKRIGREIKLLQLWSWASSLLIPAHRTNARRRGKRDKSKVLAVVLFILGVAIALITNVASGTMPESLAPYLWLSWPLLIVMTVISALLMIRQ